MTNLIVKLHPVFDAKSDFCLSLTISSTPCIYVMHCANWYHSCNLKNVKNTHGGVLTFRLKACNFTESNTPPWAFSTFLKL